MKKTDSCFDILRSMKDFSVPMKYVFDKGQIFDSSTLTDNEFEFLKSALTLIGSSLKTTPKQCYSNSQIFLLSLHTMSLLDRSDVRIRYCEGFFIDKKLPLPISHGWISLNNKIIDITLTQSEYETKLPKLKIKVIAQIPDNFVYIGVEIDTDFVLKRMIDDGEAFTVLDDGRNTLKYLKQIGEFEN